MKKFTVLFLACMLFSVNVCNAKIFNQKDEFTGGTTIFSSNFCNSKNNDLEIIYLYQTKTKQNIKYKIKGKVTTYQQFGLSDKVAQINIDGDITYDLPILNREIIKIVRESLYIVDYQAPQEIIDKIKTANRVALKFTQNDGSQFVFVLPENVLAEWKEVIAMEK